MPTNSVGNSLLVKRPVTVSRINILQYNTNLMTVVKKERCVQINAKNADTYATRNSSFFKKLTQSFSNYFFLKKLLEFARNVC